MSRQLPIDITCHHILSLTKCNPIPIRAIKAVQHIGNVIFFISFFIFIFIMILISTKPGSIKSALHIERANTNVLKPY